tara:strand:+ start:545 stop:1006 length:462 start_codon:yes stop_codon:yes gene_type:complete
MQQYDEIINCPKTGGDLCYKVEVTPEVTNYFSMSCGFWTNSLMKKGEEFFEQQMSVLPEIYKDLAWIDTETELVWLPNTINLPTQGMVFAEGVDAENWSWSAVKAVELDEPEEDKQGNKITHKPDMTTIKRFNERDYMDALSYIGILPGGDED